MARWNRGARWRRSGCPISTARCCGPARRARRARRRISRSSRRGAPGGRRAIWRRWSRRRCVQQLSLDLAALQRRDVELSAQYGERHPERVKVKDAIKFTESRLDAEVDARDRRDGASGRRRARQDERERDRRALRADAPSRPLSAAARVSYDALKQDLANDRALLDKLQQRAREMTLSRDYNPTSVRVIDAAEVPRVAASRREMAQRDARRRRRVRAGAAARVRPALPRRARALARGHQGAPRPAMPRAWCRSSRARRPARVGTLHAAGLDRGWRCRAPSARRCGTCARRCSARRPARRRASCWWRAPAMQEGKTLVATNLAAGLAHVGHRVLLIDLDLRQPSVHRAFDAPVQPGLSELLSGVATASEAIRPTTVRDLWILTAGRPLSNPGDLLGSAAFSRMLKSLPSSFDRIVLDSPPVMAFTDASLIAHEQAGIVFVVSADRTGRRAAQAALERLEAVGARFVGAVLNRVAPERIDTGSYFDDDDDEDAYVEYATVPVPASRRPRHRRPRTGDAGHDAASRSSRRAAARAASRARTSVPVAGKPLLAYTIEHASATPSIDRVVVSTDDAEIGEVAARYGAEVIWRPAEISGDRASSEAALLHALDELDGARGLSARSRGDAAGDVAAAPSGRRAARDRDADRGGRGLAVLRVHGARIPVASRRTGPVVDRLRLSRSPHASGWTGGSARKRIHLRDAPRSAARDAQSPRRTHRRLSHGAARFLPGGRSVGPRADGASARDRRRRLSVDRGRAAKGTTAFSRAEAEPSRSRPRGSMSICWCWTSTG